MRTPGFQNTYFTLLLVCLFFLCVGCLTPYSVSIADTVDDEVSRIQKAYEGIRDLSGSFVQKSYIKDLKRTDTFKGKFFIKRPMKLKWVYQGKNAQEVFIKDDTITVYQKQEKQVFKGKFDRETYGQAPIALLSGFGDIQKEFSVSGTDGKLLLKPKKPMGGITSIEIRISQEGFPIQSFLVNDTYSNRIEMTLKEIVVNKGLEDALFEISLPEDVSVYEHNL
jgi:outer membrane lipoprotein carrier protein